MDKKEFLEIVERAQVQNMTMDILVGGQDPMYWDRIAVCKQFNKSDRKIIIADGGELEGSLRMIGNYIYGIGSGREVKGRNGRTYYRTSCKFNVKDVTEIELHEDKINSRTATYNTEEYHCCGL